MPIEHGSEPQIADWALIYCRRAWSVVPIHSSAADGTCGCGRSDCPSPGKHPLIRWENAMIEAADEETVAGWWRRWPDANIAVVTGSVSGVAVVDVDPRHDGDATLAALESTRGQLPPTLQSRTGGGGRHLWFTMSEDGLASDELGPGLELKAERGIVVTPPSIHASGREYEWLDYSIEPAALPDWVCRLAGSRRNHSKTARPPTPVRTEAEREEFRKAWAQAGIDLREGDAYYLCPFHDDHHPSLHVDAEGCRWYCFACRIGGGTGRLYRKLGIETPQAPRSRMRGRVGAPQAITLRGDEQVAVVGESFHQDELLELAGGQRRFGGVDLEAVADLVLIEDDGIEVLIDGRQVGFLPGSDTSRFVDMIEGSLDIHGFASCRASIRGGWDRGRGDVGLFGVTLWLPEPAEGG